MRIRLHSPAFWLHDCSFQAGKAKKKSEEAAEQATDGVRGKKNRKKKKKATQLKNFYSFQVISTFVFEIRQIVIDLVKISVSNPYSIESGSGQKSQSGS